MEALRKATELTAARLDQLPPVPINRPPRRRDVDPHTLL